MGFPRSRRPDKEFTRKGKRPEARALWQHAFEDGKEEAIRSVLAKDNIVAIGQLKPLARRTLARMVKRGEVLEYTDYTFPVTKRGYALVRGQAHQREREEFDSWLASARSIEKNPDQFIPSGVLLAQRAYPELPHDGAEALVRQRMYDERKRFWASMKKP